MRKMANLLDASDDDELANSGFERMQKAVAIDGYRDGVIDGKESTVQAGFNEGFSCAASLAFKLQRWRGMASGILASRCSTNTELQRLCKDVLRRVDALRSLDIHTSEQSTDTKGTTVTGHRNVHKQINEHDGASSFCDSVPPISDTLHLLRFHSQRDMLDAIEVDRREEVIQLMEIISQITRQLDAILIESHTTAL
ncbi:uncharacterized protein LOC134193410 [Corticium candelabrum]|uniref:uncharacterized protein LOC134193410 n=1 Tax=Corticium candelabrum TaxID=121492 RepID=UPI002E25E26B|nr:uncharacterized protein LOC134193410 [Corticium candelabrum]